MKPVSQEYPILDERFWSKVRKTDTCWLWTAAVDLKGYGQFGLGDKTLGLAHRLSFAAAFGPIPDSAHVLHRCDHRDCVRPDHLWLGTHQENMLDCAQKGRAGQRGERSFRTRLNPEAIKVMRFLAARGIDGARLGHAYGVSTFGISCIVRGLTWKHLPGPFTFAGRGRKWPKVLYRLP